MLTVNDTLIPSRMLLITAHFISTIMVWMTMAGNVAVSSPFGATTTNAVYISMNSSLTAAVVLTWICLFIQFVGMILGLSLFNKSLNAILCLASAAATITSSLFIVGVWNVAIYWWIWGFCCLIPTSLECLFMYRVTVLKLNK